MLKALPKLTREVLCLAVVSFGVSLPAQVEFEASSSIKPFGLNTKARILAKPSLDGSILHAPLSTTSPYFQADATPGGKVARFLTPAESFNKKRFWIGSGTGAAIYGGFAVGLWEAWYKDYPIGGFRLKDDRGEWLDMDKFGHSYTAYHYARWGFQGSRWAGLERRQALLMGAGISTLLQSTVEVMDGFSKQWGFSWWDMGANASGVALFAAQELAWKEQRVRMKMSSYNPGYSTEPMFARNKTSGPTSSVAFRAEQLYGDSPWQRFIKDYNGQTIWLSANPAVLFGRETKTPWLMVSAGYSVDNVVGAFGNVWRDNGGLVYRLDDVAFPRRREYVLSIDIDFERIPAKHPALKTFLHLINHMKIPAPAVLFSDGNSPAVRWLYY